MFFAPEVSNLISATNAISQIYRPILPPPVASSSPVNPTDVPPAVVGDIWEAFAAASGLDSVPHRPFPVALTAADHLNLVISTAVKAIEHVQASISEAEAAEAEAP